MPIYFRTCNNCVCFVVVVCIMLYLCLLYGCFALTLYFVLIVIIIN